MRRRIVLATLGVTTMALVIFGVPLVWALSRVYRGEQLSQLQGEATRAAAAVPAEGLRSADPVEPPSAGRGVRVAYYDGLGHLAVGFGPSTPDARVRQALAGRPSQGDTGDRLAFAQPIIANEVTTGVVEASSSASAVTDRVIRSGVLMAGLALAALGAAAVVARRQARRLAAPVEGLVAAAGLLGDGDFTLRTEPSGIAELDRAGRALEVTSSRLGALLARERAFTANVSHQLRTPLTALRLDLENALETPGVDVREAVGYAVDEVDRLQATVEQLLALAATGRPTGPAVPFGEMGTAIERRWRPPLAAGGRRLHLVTDHDVDACGVPAALGQILDVLVDNAVVHGKGTVEVRASAAAGTVSVEVTDEGPGFGSVAPGPPHGAVATGPGPAPGHGLGLELAGTLAAAAGGRIVVTRSGPAPVVAVVVPAVD